MAKRMKLTPDRIRDIPHPKVSGKKKFLWDSHTNGLGVVSTLRKKNFIFQGRFNEKTLRITIGAVSSWTVDKARDRARDIAQLIGQGIDPREEKKRSIAVEEDHRQESKRRELTIADAWAIYLEERKPHWSERHYLDHERISHKGGEEKKRGSGKTKPGALASLMPVRLYDLDAQKVQIWATKESKSRSTQTRIAFEALRAFLNWCEDHPDYKNLASPDVCSTKVKKKVLPKKKAKDDCLQREQLRSWFSGTRNYHNKVISAYLQTLLITGARREELTHLRWKDIDFKWMSLTIRDKMEGERTIPLTPYIASLLQPLPRKNQWVFASPSAQSGRLQEPRIPHNKILEYAGIRHLTIHGLRRSFGTLSEWIEVPVGVVYQIQGHKPSATAEKHYRKRPLDLLRKWHVKIEAWILEQAGIEQPLEQEKSSPLRVLSDKR